MAERGDASEEPASHYRALLDRHLAFYDALRLRERHPKSAAQRRFQDVAWGVIAAETDHEQAYVWHLTLKGIAPFGMTPPAAGTEATLAGFEPGACPVPADVGRKWDAAWRAHREGREFW